MVYKAFKGGVRSGNTLRGLHSFRTKRYSRQACIVTSSNVGPKKVFKFLDSSTDDALITSTLGSTDVVLSLNKKQRWRLPATVGHMIKTGQFDKGTKMSLLERHKLKRRSNCVRFVSNQGRLRHVAPQQKRYFSLNMNEFSDEISNRQWKRKKTEALKNLKPPELKSTKELKKGELKTMEVFTLSGKSGSGYNWLNSSKPEYRLEVFYPCPKSCSLMYNPKYTNINTPTDVEGKTEKELSSKTSKGRRRHRNKFTAKDLKMYESEIYDSESLWDEDVYSDYASDEENITSWQKEKGDLKRNNVLYEYVDVETQCSRQIEMESENILACLITQAERARFLCENDKNRLRGKNSPRHSEEDPAAVETKSHIVYTSEKNRTHTNLLPKTHEPKVRNRSRKSAKRNQAVDVIDAPVKAPFNYLDSAPVILRSEETAIETLAAKFGQLYAEADSEPRRFVINVTNDIQNLLSSYKNVEQNAAYTSYLVFVYDGVYDKDLDTFKVLFNSNICTEAMNMSTNIPFKVTSLDEIMNQVASILLDMKESSSLNYQYQDVTNKPKLKIVHDALRVNVQTVRASDESTKVLQTNAQNENTDCSLSLMKTITGLDSDAWCDICYANVNPTQSESVSSTTLTKCNHVFCDDCWRSHLRAKLRDGAVKTTCPGFDCNESVGPVTLLSLLSLSEVCQLFQRRCEEEAESAANSKWCPDPQCGRIIKLDFGNDNNDVYLDVTCTCGHEFCFSCQSQPHWPATCQQAEEYLGKLPTLNLPSQPADDLHEIVDSSTPAPALTKEVVEIMEVTGRVCPKCSKFINKNGGCNHMTCKCRHEFCWDCVQPWLGHNVCKPDKNIVFEFTRKVKVRHVSILPVTSHEKSPPKREKSRQKISMYQKALQQRLEARDNKNYPEIKKMVKKIAHMAQKNLLLKKEILCICGVEMNCQDETSLRNSPFVPHVTKFLRSCLELKYALHHVAEFAFVLLQDRPESLEKRRTLRLANDLSGYCIFIKSILELGENQDVRAAIIRLADIQVWAKRPLNVLLSTANKLKC